MVVSILTDVFNYSFAQGAIPTKGVITLLKKERNLIWEDLEDYRLITLLKGEFKIWPGSWRIISGWLSGI